MTIYRGVGGVNRQINSIYRGVGGVNRNINEIYRGVGGVNRKVFGNGVMLLKRTMNYPMLNSNLIWETSAWYVSPNNGATPPAADQFGGSPYYVKMEGDSEDGPNLRLSLKDPIDLTQFSKLCLKWQVTFEQEIYYARIYIYLGDGPTNQYLVAQVRNNTNGTVEVEFDISQYNGLKYLAFVFDCDDSVWAGIEANIYDIWLS